MWADEVPAPSAGAAGRLYGRRGAPLHAASHPYRHKDRDSRKDGHAMQPPYKHAHRHRDLDHHEHGIRHKHPYDVAHGHWHAYDYPEHDSDDHAAGSSKRDTIDAAHHPT